MPAQTCRSAHRIRLAAQPPPKPSSSRPLCLQSATPLPGSAQKNSEETSEVSIKNGGKWRFLEGQSAISTSAYTTGTEAQTTGMLGLTSASPAASSDLLTAYSKADRHFSHRFHVGAIDLIDFTSPCAEIYEIYRRKALDAGTMRETGTRREIAKGVKRRNSGPNRRVR